MKQIISVIIFAVLSHNGIISQNKNDILADVDTIYLSGFDGETRNNIQFTYALIDFLGDPVVQVGLAEGKSFITGVSLNRRGEVTEIWRARYLTDTQTDEFLLFLNKNNITFPIPTEKKDITEYKRWFKKHRDIGDVLGIPFNNILIPPSDPQYYDELLKFMEEESKRIRFTPIRGRQ